MAATNGSTISEKSKFTWPILLVIVALVASVLTFGLTSQGTQAIHTANADIHHPTAQLKLDFMGKELALQQYSEIIRRLDSIDNKLDRLQ